MAAEGPARFVTEIHDVTGDATVTAQGRGKSFTHISLSTVPKKVSLVRICSPLSESAAVLALPGPGLE